MGFQVVAEKPSFKAAMVDHVDPKEKPDIDWDARRPLSPGDVGWPKDNTTVYQVDSHRRTFRVRTRDDCYFVGDCESVALTRHGDIVVAITFDLGSVDIDTSGRMLAAFADKKKFDPYDFDAWRRTYPPGVNPVNQSGFLATGKDMTSPSLEFEIGLGSGADCDHAVRVNLIWEDLYQCTKPGGPATYFSTTRSTTGPSAGLGGFTSPPTRPSVPPRHELPDRL